MKKRVLNILKYLLFLAIGVSIFWFIYKDLPLGELKLAFKDLNYFWIAVSILFGILSQLSRAIRWNMLIRPLGYNPKWYNSFLSVFVLYFVNLIAPRAGEIVRCTVLSKYEKIPFTKLVGTVFVERMADFVTLVLLAIIIISSQLGVFIDFFNDHPEMKENLFGIFSLRNLIIGLLVISILVLIYLFVRRYILRKHNEKDNSLITKLKVIRYNLVDGIRSILKLENKWYFIGHTLFIFLMWLLMLYVIFLAFKPTSHLTIFTGMITFLMGGLAMLAPVQGGIGPWHFMVYETLFIYGIDKADGKIFALIAHASTNLIYLILGAIALILLPLINDLKKEKKENDEKEFSSEAIQK